ncbi:MAG TPA: hypothetical protein IAC44_03070 [Candidatus Merdimorpha stercoravium]|uniref:Uncharacterized protein n=1 Tax=Candidatus Merdimorpha stercoravium TaxID=2840863 RepID=A0A9D1H8V6_9FLAO|nr:hypothetical protein [Candidatus Merdimorpha stercoravium]
MKYSYFPLSASSRSIFRRLAAPFPPHRPATNPKHPSQIACRTGYPGILHALLHRPRPLKKRREGACTFPAFFQRTLVLRPSPTQ